MLTLWLFEFRHMTLSAYVVNTDSDMFMSLLFDMCAV